MAKRASVLLRCWAQRHDRRSWSDLRSGCHSCRRGLTRRQPGLADARQRVGGWRRIQRPAELRLEDAPAEGLRRGAATDSEGTPLQDSEDGSLLDLHSLLSQS